MITVDHTYLYRLADGMFKMNKFRQALYCCSEAINQAPKRQEYFLLRGNCHWKTNDTTAAINDFKEALRLNGSLLFLEFWMDFCDLLLDAGKYLDAKTILEEKIKKSALTEYVEIRSVEIRKRIMEMSEKLPAHEVDSELVQLLNRVDSTIPLTSLEKDKNEADSGQIQTPPAAIMEKDLQHEETNKMNSPPTTKTHKYSLRTRRKLRIDTNKSPTPESADSEDSGDEELLKDVIIRRKRKEKRKSESNELLKLAVTNTAKETRKKGKQKHEDEKSDSPTSRKKNTNRELDILHMFADIVLEAHEDETGKLENRTEETARFLEPEITDPKILATGDELSPILKTRSIDNLYEPPDSRIDVCSSSKRHVVEEDDAQFIAEVWAKELKKIANSNHRAFAKKVIDDILLEFQTESLQSSSVQINTDTQREQMEQ